VIIYAARKLFSADYLETCTRGAWMIPFSEKSFVRTVFWCVVVELSGEACMSFKKMDSIHHGKREKRKEEKGV